MLAHSGHPITKAGAARNHCPPIPRRYRIPLYTAIPALCTSQVMSDRNTAAICHLHALLFKIGCFHMSDRVANTQRHRKAKLDSYGVESRHSSCELPDYHQRDVMKSFRVLVRYVQKARSMPHLVPWTLSMASICSKSMYVHPAVAHIAPAI